jgi:hypothetical protein
MISSMEIGRGESSGETKAQEFFDRGEDEVVG